MDDRKQFTFYRSFYDALKVLPDDMFASAVRAVCEYALNGVELSLDPIPNAMFALIKPNLDNARRKSENGKNGSIARKTKSDKSKPKANAKQTVSKPLANSKQGKSVSNNKKEKEKEIEVENKKEIEIENECSLITPLPPKGETVGVDDAFSIFWEAYPKKVEKLKARQSFAKIHVPLEVLLKALEEQKRSPQWQKDNGAFIPNPTTWLNGARWDDELPTGKGVIPPAKVDISDLERVLNKF